jgi:soluble lytic murein transglycosylase-like protein
MDISHLICVAATALSIFPNSDTVCKHINVVVEETEKNDIDPTLLVSLIAVESNWKPHVVSHANACGLTQVLPKYTKKYGGKDRNLTCDELKDPNTSIRVGAKILNYWLHSYARGNKTTALCGYNAGFRCKGKNRNATGIRYAKKVLKYQRILKREMRKRKHEDDKHAKSCDRLFFRVGAFCL